MPNMKIVADIIERWQTIPTPELLRRWRSDECTKEEQTAIQVLLTTRGEQVPPRFTEQEMVEKTKQARKQIEGVQTRCYVAAFIFFFVILVASFVFFSLVSGHGSGPDGMFDGIILGPILVIVAIGVLISGFVWLISWFQLCGLRSKYAELVSKDTNG